MRNLSASHGVSSYSSRYMLSRFSDTYKSQSINQSINPNLYSGPSRSLVRGAPDPGQAKKNSLQKVMEFVQSFLEFILYCIVSRGVFKGWFYGFNPRNECLYRCKSLKLY